MKIDLRKIFLEEAEDLFNKIEKGLIALENAPNDRSLIAEVFRSMHTLKGGSGMIGSKKVTQFIHNLETVYDRVRAKQLEINPEIVDCTLKCLDHIKRIILFPDLTDPTDQKNDEELTKKIGDILNETLSTDVPEDELEESHDLGAFHTYLIYFKPSPDIFKNGSNPLLIIDELAELGATETYACIDVKSLKKYDPEKCYTSWNVILSTNQPLSAISDVFIFVDEYNVVDIHQLSASNLLANEDFVSQLPAQDLTAEVIQYDHLKEVVNTLGIEADFVNRVDPMLALLEEDDDESSTASETEAPKESTPVAETTISEPAAEHKLESISSIRVASDKLDELMNHVSELVTTQAGLSLYSKNNFDPMLDAISDNMEKLARQLRDIAFEMTLMEIETLFSRFHRSIRDISAQLGKAVNFITEGGDTELDKTIIENLADPLLHLIRNSLDHGIETKEERLKIGKPEKGTIKLSSYHAGAKVYIQIEDDGKGIDAKQIRAKAIEKQLIRQEDELTEKEIFDLIFMPGFSMAKDVTELSGRGVGMDVVRKNVLDLRGDITVQSKVGEGTKITIGMPLTLSVIDGLQVRVDDTDYVIPLVVVDKCFERKRAELINDFNQLVVLDGEQFPYVDLRQEFDIPEDNAPAYTSIILVQNQENKIGICVDEIIGEYQAVLKPVGKYYRNQEFISGATILGDGTIALVLDTNNIISQKTVNQKTINHE